MTEAFNIDCMAAMAEMNNNEFDLAIIDPPYGEGHNFGKRPSGLMYNKGNQWNIKPSVEYWEQLNRVNKNQIVWGGNYFSHLWPCKDFVV